MGKFQPCSSKCMFYLKSGDVGGCAYEFILPTNKAPNMAYLEVNHACHHPETFASHSQNPKNVPALTPFHISSKLEEMSSQRAEA